MVGAGAVSVPGDWAVRTMRSVSVLGSTGSVGCSTIDLLLAHRDRYQVRCLTGGRNVAILAQQAIALGAELAVIGDPAQHAALKEAVSGYPIRVASGAAAVTEAASIRVDWTMAAITGAAGLPSTLAAIRRGGAIAFANKEAPGLRGRHHVASGAGCRGNSAPGRLRT